MKGIIKTISDTFSYYFFCDPSKAVVKDLDYYIIGYFNYYVARKAEAEAARPKRDMCKHFHRFSIIGRWNDDNADFKTKGAWKMMKILQGQIHIFRIPELQALSRGRLGKLTRELKDAGFLPEVYIQQVAAAEEAKLLPHDKVVEVKTPSCR